MRPSLDEYLPKVKVLAKLLWIKVGWILGSHMSFDDLVQIGWVGMLEARERWEPDRGVSFWTFASLRVAGAMSDHIRSDPHIPISRDQRAQWLKLQPLQDLDNAEDRSLNKAEQEPHDLDLLKRLHSTLTAKELRVIYMRFFEDRTLLHVAGKMGWTEINALLYERRALAKLKRAYATPRPQSGITKLVGCRKSGPKHAFTWTNRQAYEVKRLHDHGKSYAQIGKQIGRTKSTIHRMYHTETTWMPSRPGTFHRVNISKEVFEEIQRRGAFGESVDAFLRRIFDMRKADFPRNRPQAARGGDRH